MHDRHDPVQRRRGLLISHMETNATECQVCTTPPATLRLAADGASQTVPTLQRGKFLGAEAARGATQ